MKPRRVLVTLEIETDAPLMALARSDLWTDIVRGNAELRAVATVHQAQANVVRYGKLKSKKRSKVKA